MEDPRGGGMSPLDAEHVALYLVLAFFSVLGVVGNAVAFYIFFLRRNSGTSVIFILALAGTDFITCLVTVPYTIVFEAMQYRLHYDGLCKMYMFFITSTIPYSSFIMAGIAFDRYFCICHPFLHVLNVPRARLVVLCLALPAFAFGIITGMSYGMFMEVHYVIANGSHFLGTNLSTAVAEQPGSLTNVISLGDLERLHAEEGGGGGGHVVETPHTFGNDSTLHWLPTYRRIVHNTECVMNNFYFSDDFQTGFRHVYTSCYVLCFATVVTLYVLIYKVSGGVCVCVCVAGVGGEFLIYKVCVGVVVVITWVSCLFVDGVGGEGGGGSVWLVYV